MMQEDTIRKNKTKKGKYNSVSNENTFEVCHLEEKPVEFCSKTIHLEFLKLILYFQGKQHYDLENFLSY